MSAYADRDAFAPGKRMPRVFRRLDGTTIVETPPFTDWAYAWHWAIAHAYDMSRADLRNMRLCYYYARPTGPRGERADNVLAKLSGADLSGSRLTSVDLSGSDMRGAIMRGVNACGARFGSGCDLSGADLTDADLRGTDLELGILTGAILRGARLDGAKIVLTRF